VGESVILLNLKKTTIKAFFIFSLVWVELERKEGQSSIHPTVELS